MDRAQLEHILRASAAITGGDQFVIIGSQAIWAHAEHPPRELVESIEADVFTFRSPQDERLGATRMGPQRHSAVEARWRRIMAAG